MKYTSLVKTGIACLNVLGTSLLATISEPSPELIAENPALFKGNWTADKVAEVAELKYDGDTMISHVTMTLVDNRGRQRIREMKLYRKDTGAEMEDEYLCTVFLEPADIRNSAFLNYEYDDDSREEQAWLYLPALRKVKRLSASDKSDAFMGSDFSYNDLKTNHREYWNYSFISESEMIDGEECWVIEGQPREDRLDQIRKETGYQKTRLWIQKNNFTKVRGQFWLIKGKRIKLMKASNVQKIDGVWTPLKLSMVTTKNGRVEHSTIMHYSDVVYNEPIEDSFLTPHGIESGF